MTLNASGPISLGGTTAGQSIEIENGGNGTTQISLNDTAVRNLAGGSATATGSVIIMPTNFYGKSNRVNVTVTISANTTNYVFNKCKIAGYSAGKTCATLKINTGVYISATSTGCKALTVPNTWTSGDVVKITNCGFIVGAGGSGGSGGGAFQPSSGGGGAAGGTALSVSYPVSITNNNTVGGGGGGGGGGQGAAQSFSWCCQGSPSGGTLAANGGAGGTGQGLSAATSGSPGGFSSSPCSQYVAGGSGGSGGNWGATGGGGGGANSCNTNALTRAGPAGGGGSGGPATSGNSLITWTVTGNRYGPLN